MLKQILVTCTIGNILRTARGMQLNGFKILLLGQTSSHEKKKKIITKDQFS